MRAYGTPSAASAPAPSAATSTPSADSWDADIAAVVGFDLNASKPTGANQEIDGLIGAVSSNSCPLVVIRYASQVGSDCINRAISLARAKAVVAYLKKAHSRRPYYRVRGRPDQPVWRYAPSQLACRDIDVYQLTKKHRHGSPAAAIASGFRQISLQWSRAAGCQNSLWSWSGLRAAVWSAPNPAFRVPA